MVPTVYLYDERYLQRDMSRFINGLEEMLIVVFQGPYSQRFFFFVTYNWAQ